jgi:hypothetical protein
MEVGVGVPPLGIHIDSLQAQWKVKVEESEVSGTIREAVGNVERHLGVAKGRSDKTRRGRRLESKPSR